MKTVRNLCLLVILHAFMCGCSDKNKDERAGGTKEIVVTQSHIGCLAGETTRIGILTKGRYSLSLSDPGLVSIQWLDGLNIFDVTTGKVGEGSIFIHDNYGLMEDAEITVSANYFGGTFVEADDPSGEIELSISIRTLYDYHNPDPQLREQIEQELHSYYLSKLNTVYRFDANDWSFTVDQTGNEPQGGTDKGTYEWTPVYGTLRLHYDDGRTDSFLHVFKITDTVFYLNEDLTEYYKEKYPEAGITSVNISRTMIRQREDQKRTLPQDY